MALDLGLCGNFRESPGKCLRYSARKEARCVSEFSGQVAVEGTRRPKLVGWASPPAQFKVLESPGVYVSESPGLKPFT